MNRHDRRALAKKHGFKRSAASNVLPTSRRPAILTFWRAPEQVWGHIYTYCRTLFNEWAGRELGHPRNRKWTQAMHLVRGICPACTARYRLETR